MNSTQLHSFSCGKVYLWLSAFALGGMVLTAHYQLNTVDGTNFTGTIVPSTLDCAAPGERRSPFVPVPPSLAWHTLIFDLPYQERRSLLLVHILCLASAGRCPVVSEGPSIVRNCVASRVDTVV